MKSTIYSLLGMLFLIFFPAIHSISPPQAPVYEAGNWVKNREWYKQSHEIQEAIQSDLIAIKKSRSKYEKPFADIDTYMNAFYSKYGLEKGNMMAFIKRRESAIEGLKKEQLSYLERKVAKERLPSTYYDIHLEAMENEIKQYKHDVEQLSLDVKSIQELDEAITQRLSVLDSHIQQAEEEASQAGEKVTSLSETVDDKKSRLIFYELKDVHKEKIKAIKYYVEVTLFNDFKTLIDRLKSHIKVVEKEFEKINENEKNMERQRVATPYVEDDFLSGDDDAGEDILFDQPSSRRVKIKQTSFSIMDQLSAGWKRVTQAIIDFFDTILSFL